MVKKKIPSPRRESNPRTTIVQPVARRYTDWAITTYKLIVIQLVNKFPAFYGTQGQTGGPYPEPDESSQVFLIFPKHATCPVHLVILDFIPPLEEVWPPLYLYARFCNKKPLTGWSNTTPNPEPGGPVDYT
jgi:hypothetical protein